MKIPQDVIIQFASPDKWLFYNVFTQTTLALGIESIHFLNELLADEKNISCTENKLRIWKIGLFSNYNGLLCDPTRRIRDVDAWPAALYLNGEEFIELMNKEYMLITDEEKYNSLFKLKKSLFDTENLGNFHQQLGQFLLLNKREDPGIWWTKQKFNSDYTGLNNTLYKSIQENFLKSFFNDKFNKNHSIIDIGCGTGYYTKMMGQNGSNVLGIDPNAKYIEIAQKSAQSNVSFQVSNIGNLGNLDWIPSNSIDLIFMSDALLFYFVSPNPNQKQNIDILFSDIKRILKPHGRFFSMEPNGLFWLRPWLGEEERPFTIITEHTSKQFNVAPTCNELIHEFLRNGFKICSFEEIKVDKEFSKIDRRATNFAKEFPLWNFFELEPIK